jgi:hypothetical protein
MQAQRGGGGHADTRSGTGHRVRLTRTAQSTHRQAGIPALPGSRAAYLLVLYQTIHAVTARRDVEPSWTVSGEALFPVHLPQRQDTLPAASMRVKVWASSPNRPDGYQKRHGMLNLTANPKTPRWSASAASRSCHRAGRVVVPDLFIRPAHDDVSDVAPSCHTYNFKEAGGVCLIHESSATVIVRQFRWPVLAECQPAEQPIRGRHR